MWFSAPVAYRGGWFGGFKHTPPRYATAREWGGAGPLRAVAPKTNDAGD